MLIADCLSLAGCTPAEPVYLSADRIKVKHALVFIVRKLIADRTNTTDLTN